MVILLLEVASCRRNLSGCPVVMLPQVDNLTKMLKKSDIEPVKVFGLSDILQLFSIRLVSDISTNVHAVVGRTREKKKIQNSFKLKYVSFFQITIHTDTLNESACVEQSIAAFKVYYS